MNIQGAGFSADNVPGEWTSSSPCLLTDKDLVYCLLELGDNMRDRLTRLELVVVYTGGKLFYKAQGDSMVGIKVTWPNAT